jgi:hypothetical protein
MISGNIFYAFRLNGTFTWIRTRAVILSQHGTRLVDAGKTPASSVYLFATASDASSSVSARDFFSSQSRLSRLRRSFALPQPRRFAPLPLTLALTTGPPLLGPRHFLAVWASQDLCNLQFCF